MSSADQHQRDFADKARLQRIAREQERKARLGTTAERPGDRGDEPPTLDYILAGCTCDKTGTFTDAMRDNYGVELHWPYCPVGILERERDTIEFTPFGTQGAETKEES